MRRRMTKKKIIKIQSDSEEAPKNEPAEEMLTKDDHSMQFESDRGDQSDAVDPVKDLEARLDAKSKEAEETYDRLLRVSAEFENYKKRSARDMEEFRKFANQSLIKEMLAVVDNLELAMNTAQGHKSIEKSLLEGLDMTHREILKVFEKFNVTPIEAKGKPFDPAFHEAVMQEETDEFPENAVSQELQKGYLIHDRLLRPAMVVVAKPGGANKKENKSAEE